MDESGTITVLHLSDIQFGRNHRFGRLALPPPDDDFDTLLTRLADDLKSLRESEAISPQILLLTGDLTESGRKNEFEDVLQFVQQITSFLKLTPGHVALVPGNHDVNQTLCHAYFMNCNAHCRNPAFPYWPKWEYYKWLFHSFYRDFPGITFTEEQPWSLFEIPDLKVVVAGLNSTMAETHENHRGYLGEAQLSWFADRLAEYKREGWLCLGAVHHNIHNVRQGPTAGDECLHDTDDLRHYLADMLNVIFHGHTHDGKLYWLTQHVPIVSTGSAALVAGDRPDKVPHQYQIVQISATEVRRWARQYVRGNKRWTGDTRVSADGNGWLEAKKVAFQDVYASSPRGVQTPRTGPEYDVFFSYSRVDGAWVEQLARKVEDSCGLRVWLDKWVLVLGKHWQQEIARGLEMAASCAVFIGASTPEGWFQEEIESALVLQNSNPDFRVIPVLLPDGDPGVVSRFLALRMWADFRQGQDQEYAFHTLIQGIRGLPAGRWPSDPSPGCDDGVAYYEQRLRELQRLKIYGIHEAVVIEFERKILDQWLGERR